MHQVTRILYRQYKKMRCYFSSQPPRLFAATFFAVRGYLQKLTATRKVNISDQQESRLWKAIYFDRFGTNPLYRIETDHPIAIDSSDHKWPKGTAFDNSRNINFNLKLYNMFNYRSDLCVLDIGCSGGGFVKSFLEDGYVGIGVEGSDWSRKLRSGEWDTCPHHLLTGDITKPFQIRAASGEGMRFHCITAWEVLEHIPTESIPELIENVSRHLAPDGIFVASVDTAPDGNPITGAIYHVTLQSKDWWLKQFERVGLIECNKHIFTTTDYVRGHGIGLSDWDPSDGDGFHLVLHRVKNT